MDLVKYDGNCTKYFMSKNMNIDWQKWLLFLIGTKIIKPYEFEERYHKNSLIGIKESLSKELQKEVSKSKPNEELIEEIYRMEK